MPSFGLAIFMAICALLGLALVLTALAVAGRSLSGWTRALATVLVLLSVTLLLFLFARDDYRQDGTRNDEAYDLEYAVIPTVALAGLATTWLIRREGTRAVAWASPLIAIGGAFAAAVCFLLTTN